MQVCGAWKRAPLERPINSVLLMQAFEVTFAVLHTFHLVIRVAIQVVLEGVEFDLFTLLNQLKLTPRPAQCHSPKAAGAVAILDEPSEERCGFLVVCINHYQVFTEIPPGLQRVLGISVADFIYFVVFVVVFGFKHLF